MKFTSIVTEDWVLSVFRNATESGTLGGFSVNASSIVGIAPIIPRTTKPPTTTTTPKPGGMFPLKVARNSFVGRAQTGFQFTRETQKRNKQKWRRALVWI